MKSSQQETSRKRAAESGQRIVISFSESVVSGEINEPSLGQWGHLYVA